MKQPNHRRLQTQALVENKQNMQYLLTLYIGDKMTPQKLLLDTGSAWLWLPGSDCNTCTRQSLAYDYSDSTTFNKSDEESKINYAMGWV